MKLKRWLFFVMISGLAFEVYAQNPQGFVSLDCGAANGSYIEPDTGLEYTSDEQFIDTGESRFILPEYQKDIKRHGLTLRSFPDGNRNCYKIGITKGTKYLIRAVFVYGNYDGKLLPPSFDLYLGTDLWDSVTFASPLRYVDKEIIHVPPKNDAIHVCLAKTGSGVPFITTLELRPLDNATYTEIPGSFLNIERMDAGSTKSYRYSDDVFDRFWEGFVSDDWMNIHTSLDVNVSANDLLPPQAVVRTAIAPKTGDVLSLDWEIPSYTGLHYYVFLHFVQLERLQANQSIEIQISYNGRLFYGPFSPSFLQLQTIYNTNALTGKSHKFSISKTANSTLPPFINAWEFYAQKEFSSIETHQRDANAVATIKSTCGIKRNWQGDPCLPKLYLWEGIACSYDDDNQLPPKVVSLDLSSSGLTGHILPSIADLEDIQNLDLSNNNLSGPVPEFLSLLPKLKVLNLENNNLTGPIPIELEQKWKDGLLSLSVCGNPKLSSTITCKRKKKNCVLPIVASVVGAFTFGIIVAAIWWVLKKKRQGRATDPKHNFKNVSLETRKLQYFAYSEIVNCTNNFERVLGEGGFGKVYYGYLNNTQVAVKMLSLSSVQGYHQFQAEVNLLMRVHHKNLTSLVGYCNDEKNIALIYEYMANGNLYQYLSDRSDPSTVLKWEDRLQIATDAAQGLEYLHYGCRPPIIHRDVKTANILLNENFQAKLSDFGLSRVIQGHAQTHVSTVIAGTPGYLDPEYYMSNKLNEKSDVYSFGVVLLEIVTGRPAISNCLEKSHISQWVKQMLSNGVIESVVDPRLEGNFNTNSAWKVVEVAINCVSRYSIERPTMSEVVGELKESLEMGLDLMIREDFNTSAEPRSRTQTMPLMSINCDEFSTPSAR